MWFTISYHVAVDLYFLFEALSLERIDYSTSLVDLDSMK